MKLLVLRSEGKFHKLYKSGLIAYRNHQEFITLMQIFVLIAGVLCCGLIYILLINKASTEGYFLRQANNHLDSTTFNYKIVKADILELKQQNRSKITNSEQYGPSL